MKKCIAVLVLVTAAVLALAGCGRDKKTILAEVNGQVITLEEFNKKIEMMPKQYRDMLKGQERRYLDELANEILLYQEALKANIIKDPEVRDIIEEAKRKILIANLIKKQVDDTINITDEELKEYYDSHSEEFILPERLRAAHILVDTEAEAEAIKAELAKGASFEELARTRSKDATGKQDGDIGYFSKGQLIPEFEKAAAALGVGQTSGIVKSQFGYHIIKLTERKPPELQPFEQIKDIIGKDLYRDKKIKKLEALMADLKQKADVTINEQLLQKPAAEVPTEPQK